MITAPGAAHVALAQVQRPLALFAQGIAGRPLAVQAFDGLTGVAGEDSVDTLFLPEVVDKFESRDGNLRVYRIETLRQSHAAEPAGRQVLGAALALTARPRLLRRIFRIVERLRVDAALLRLYPGAALDLQRQRQHELSRRQPVRPARRLPWLIDSLHRAALGADVAALAAADHSGQLSILLRAMVPLHETGASQIDSLRAAQHICEMLDPQISLRVAPHLSSAVMSPSVQGDVPGGVGDAPDGPEMPGDGADALDEGFARAGDFHAKAAAHGLRRHHATPQDDNKGGRNEKGDAPQLASPRKRQDAANIDRPKQVSAQSPDHPSQAPYRFHDEWDYLAQRYRPAWCRVHEERLKGENPQFLQQVRERHGAVLQAVRRRFAAIRPETRQRVRGLIDGEELDLDRAIRSRIERRAGHLGDGRLFTSPQKLQRDVSAAFLVDMSGSTGYVIPQTQAPGDAREEEEDEPYFHAPSVRPLAVPKQAARRVIDVARDSLCLMCDALDGLGDRLAVYGFSGHNRHNVEFLVAKEFHEPWSSTAAMALSGMQPRGYTRTGAAIRHATWRLAREAAATRVLIVITDGYPQDTDYGPDPASFEYGIHDTARALREAARAGIASFCISIDHAANDYLRRMCSPQQYLVLPDVTELPEQLVKVYRTLTSG